MAELSADKGAKPNSMRIGAAELRRFVADLFVAVGVSRSGATLVADALVEADLQGLPSHGVMQAEGYLSRLKRGVGSPRDRAELVVDRGSIAVLDAHDMLGQLSADQAMRLAVERAREHGVGVVAVRRGSHFGAAGRYALIAADSGCIGVVMANTSSVMPAPGGLDRLVGTNPLAVAIPTSCEPMIVFDMATSEGSVGKIRVAARAGRAIPANWAVRADGTPTTDSQEALKGMLLPFGGAKGFGLSFVVDLLCGLLSSGAWGDQVHGNAHGAAKPHNSSHLFIAIDAAHFRPVEEFRAQAQAAADRVRASRRQPGVDRIMVPGERKWETRRASGERVELEATQVASLTKLAGELGVDSSVLNAASGV